MCTDLLMGDRGQGGGHQQWLVLKHNVKSLLEVLSGLFLSVLQNFSHQHVAPFALMVAAAQTCSVMITSACSPSFFTWSTINLSGLSTIKDLWSPEGVLCYLSQVKTLTQR